MKNKVERAIIMAAGFGSRLLPITKEIPKPLLSVNGVRMIDTVINALHEQGIYEIYVVVGHLKEKFDVLEKEYPGVRLIENPFYKECNNISSLFVAREYIPNAIILDGDQIIYNSKILCPEFEVSGYNCIWTDRKTNEWILNVEDGMVKSCNRDGGEKGWQLYSVSRWSEDDGNLLKKHIEIEFLQNKNRQIYWDDVALFCYPDEYKLGIKPMQQGDIIEIDSLDELVEIDQSYRKYL